MDPTAIFAFGTELLKAFNAAQANKPPDQVRAEAILTWGIVKAILKPFLTTEQKKELEAAGVSL